ncbi:unnamed protein product [Moneuplotes crassus]|uniref:Uncharacterized protein n=1 Tax=Euplotes crassus TaxID=5936 RepID=A0AAD1X9Y3_EUPCR|nr:unnamed protein product [Moneuplotes crassus]
MSSEDKEEVFVLEKAEISVDDDEGYDYNEIKDSDDDQIFLKDGSESDDLEDFERLKHNTDVKKIEKQTQGKSQLGTQFMKTKYESKPKVVKRHVVIDDFIRNYLAKYNMHKTLNIFQNEWSQLQKKGTFNDNYIGLITDTENKNARMEERIQRMKIELEKEEVKAEKAKSTWLKLRKERDFHKTHTQRVQKEKEQITSNMSKLRDLQEQYEDKINELMKKYEVTLKEKTLLKLEKEKLQKKALDIKARIKEKEDDVAYAIEKSKARDSGAAKGKQILKMKGQNTPYPSDDARPNPFLAREYDDFNVKAASQKIVKAHDVGIGGMCLHFKKQIVATVSDDCMWKIWNMEDGENILSGEGHKNWLSGVDFHPAGSHLVTSGGDTTIKIWDFINSCCSVVFTDHTQPVWSVKFHDTGDFVLSGSMDGSMKLFDVNAERSRQAYRGHTDSVNSVNFQPFTNFFVSASADKTISVWDMRTGLTIQTFYGHLNSVNEAAFSISGHLISSCDSDGIVKVWDIRMVQEVVQLDTGDSIAHSVCFDKTNNVVAVGCADASIKMINIEKGEIISTLKGHDDAVNSVIIDQENSTLFSASSDGTIRAWR